MNSKSDNVRQVNFVSPDGSEIVLNCQPVFESYVRKYYNLPEGEFVTDEQIKNVFITALSKTSV